MLRSLGFNPTNGELTDMINELDDCNGIIDFQDFLILMAKKLNNSHEDSFQEILSAFMIFDKTGRGLINVSDLEHVLVSVGEKPTDSDIVEMIRAAEVNVDGMINIEQFVRKMMS